jgi:hypothetical protein
MKKSTKYSEITEQNIFEDNFNFDETNFSLLNFPYTSSSNIERIIAWETHIYWLKKYVYGKVRKFQLNK